MSELPSKRQLNEAGHLVRELRLAASLREFDRLDKYDPRMLTDALDLVRGWRAQHAQPLGRVNAGLRYYIRKAGPDPPQVTQRLKRLSTIAHKLEREPRMALARMEDVGGVRAVLLTQRQVLAVCEMLDRAKRWTIRRRRFYIDGGDPGPKDDGYRAVHYVVAKDGCYVEIQFRTPWQDSWAQSVEQDTRRLRTDLKFGAGPDDLREYYWMVSELFAMRQDGLEPEQEFMEDLAKRYAETRRYFPAPTEYHEPQ